MPPDGHRSEGTLSLSEVPYAGAKPFAYFSASGKVSRCKSETASGSTRSNGYAPTPQISGSFYTGYESRDISKLEDRK